MDIAHYCNSEVVGLSHVPNKRKKKRKEKKFRGELEKNIIHALDCFEITSCLSVNLKKSKVA